MSIGTGGLHLMLASSSLLYSKKVTFSEKVHWVKACISLVTKSWLR